MRLAYWRHGADDIRLNTWQIMLVRATSSSGHILYWIVGRSHAFVSTYNAVIMLLQAKLLQISGFGILRKDQRVDPTCSALVGRVSE